MKQLTLIVRSRIQQDLTDQLRMMEQIHGFTLSHVEGHGEQAEGDPFLSARDKVVGYTPRIRIDVVLRAVDLDIVLQELKKTIGGSKSGKGIYYWVAAVEQSGHL
ncbi:MAG: DUF3240 family protein [Ghiorsea sp.]|nr:DUF3240 family protein [Ghiorsea sp.]